MKAEISFDLIMDDDMDFVEGTYRLPGQDWEVFIFSRYAITKPEVKVGCRWASGVTGVSVRFPQSGKLSKTVVLHTLADALGVTEWNEVHGPDSMRLR